MVVEIIEFECVYARVCGPCVDWGRALTSENGYSLTSWVLPVAVGTATCGHSPLSRVLLIVVGAPHYRGYSSLSWVLLIVVGTPHYQEYSPLWILPSIMGVPRNHRYSYLWVLTNIVGTSSAGFLQLLALD